jgi:hypothetical protein
LVNSNSGDCYVLKTTNRNDCAHGDLYYADRYYSFDHVERTVFTTN